MKVLGFVLALALVVAATPGVATAADAQVHFTIVNKRSAAVLVYGKGSPCQSDITVDGGKTAAYACVAPIGQAFTFQIRNTNMQGLLCLPNVFVTDGPNSSFTEMQAGETTKYCTMVKTGPVAYTIEIDADQGNFTIEARSHLAVGATIIANNDSCTPRFQQTLNPNASIEFTCARAAVMSDAPLEVMVQDSHYTAVFCFARWLDGQAEVKSGKCTIEHDGPNKDILTLH